ncbi:APC family permease [Acidithiobacillus ferridurans]|uniref:Amino acid permease n=2 Tax=Acidithiobacillus ferridurans TaxID=1232575 RepID=A0A8X8GIU9_ACIFI|nr:APC family permease [Acidithiobacillus ferridurans]MBU2724443.1 amino acid permease [Acidithiobacillus ferridurans]MBU2725529.1 amino acid permease [Acidithiobacillus ferridurans]BBF63835.1 Inner membrane transport protein YbaT [Acidithiobacillus ferridurans]
MSKAGDGKMGLWAVVALGVGGMVGGGIFAVLGLAVQLAHGGTPLAFALAGMVALLTAYSYAKLSVAYPSRGGTVVFLDRTFGAGMFTGSLNVLLWLSYVVMLSLYAFAFGSYGATFLPQAWQGIGKHALISFAVITIAGMNLLNAELIGKAEIWIVAIKLAILLLFVGVGIFGINASRIAPGSWSPPLQLAAGGMIIFLAYEGFELIANTANDVRDVAKTLPRAYYTAVGFVIALYVLVALVTVGNLPVDKIVAAKDFALAEAARPFLGQTGFTLIAIAAMLSTASAINATLYGAARLSYCIARDGELPAILERKVWGQPVEGLLITAGLTLIVANVFDLTSIATMGSAGFLLIFAAVNSANARHAPHTHSRGWISAAGALACLLALGALVWQTATTGPAKLWVLAAMLALALLIEGAFRLAKREIRLHE